MNASQQEVPERQEIEALLPWHAVGTLSPSDAERVERALASDGELARRFELVCEELHETIHLNDSLGVPSGRAAEKLFAAIEAEGARAPVRRRTSDLAGRLAAFISSFAPRTLAYAAGAAAVAILLQAGLLTTVLLKDQTGNQYGLASHSTGDVPRVVVRFTPQATSADITKFLDAHKAEMIGGPKKGSLYTLRLTALPSGTPISTVVRQMQGDSQVVDFVAAKE